MPGLIGYTDKHHKYDIDMILNMAQLLKHFNWHISETAFSDRVFYASRTHLGVIDQGTQPVEVNNRFYSWLEGEFYNREELILKHSVKAVNDNDLLLKLYCKTLSFDFLQEVDGYYVSVLYDKLKSIVYLITDRYGFKPLYWGIINDNLVWSSELKGFLGHKDFKVNIDHEAVEQFFDIGYLLENRTWFEGFELMPPASVLSFNIKESKIETTHYWSWSEIKPIKGSIDEQEVADEIGRLFKKAVLKRINLNERIGVSLSGGLDSRAILAAVPDDYKPLHTFTFGQKNCDDIRIAMQVSNIKKANHHTFLLSEDNWLAPRIKGVWGTDGLLNLLHMHGIKFGDAYKSFIDINLNGFAGDLVLGGSYLTEKNLDERITPKIARDIMKNNTDMIQFKEWYLINKTDPFFINNRVRRFTNCGSILFSQYVEQRKPFFDNKLIEFVYSLPDLLRYKSYIYNKMLLSCFSKYYMSIKWQKTGSCICDPEYLVRLIGLKRRVENRLKREANRIGLKFADWGFYHNYPYWIRQKPTKTIFENIIYSKNAIYPDYVDKGNIQMFLRDHMLNKANYANELCQALTFELWLQQIYEGKYRE
jgi:asparagine synthase (glutamine-hydrolysing)